MPLLEISSRDFGFSYVRTRCFTFPLSKTLQLKPNYNQIIEPISFINMKGHVKGEKVLLLDFFPRNIDYFQLKQASFSNMKPHLGYDK